MITGRVSANREAIIELKVAGPDRRSQQIEAVIDTGFNGYLTLPKNLIASVNLLSVGTRRATLGDGSVVVLEVYLATVLWHGQEREVLVLQADGGPLLGMSLLFGNRVMLEVVEDGGVVIEELT